MIKYMNAWVYPLSKNMSYIDKPTSRTKFTTPFHSRDNIYAIEMKIILLHKQKPLSSHIVEIANPKIAPHPQTQKSKIHKLRNRRDHIYSKSHQIANRHTEPNETQ